MTLCNILDRQHGLIEFASVGSFFGLGSLGNVLELYERKVALHFDAHNLSIRLKEHFQIFFTCGFFVKIDHEQCFVRFNVLATFVFFALDATIAPSKLGADFARYIRHFPVLQVG
jgi:hypothetical protein